MFGFGARRAKRSSGQPEDFQPDIPFVYAGTGSSANPGTIGDIPLLQGAVSSGPHWLEEPAESIDEIQIISQLVIFQPMFIIFGDIVVTSDGKRKMIIRVFRRC